MGFLRRQQEAEAPLGLELGNDVEAPRIRVEKRAGCCQIVLSAVWVANHLTFLGTMIWLAISPPQVGKMEERLIKMDVSAYVDEVRLGLTLLIAPFLIYETCKHWYNGTFFPFTAADSFYTLRRGRIPNRNPEHIRCSTVLNMIWLGLFYSLLTIWNCLGVAIEVNIKDLPKLDRLTEVQLCAKGTLLLISALLKIKTFVLTTIFIVLTLTLFSLTVPISLVVVLDCIFRGFNREDKLFCCPYKWLYDFVAFFYRNL